MNRLQADACRAVLFDFGGTLDSDGINWKERFYPIYRQEGFNWPFKKFQKLFFETDDYLTGQQLEKENYRQTIELQVSTLLERAGNSDRSKALRIAGKFCAESMKYLRRNIPLIQKLAARYPLGIVSNFYGNVDSVLRDLKIAPFFQTIVDSTKVGCMKPDPAIFRAALREMQISAEQALFVGDSVSRDMRGARQLNMPHVWLKGKGLRPDSKTGKALAPCCKRDRVIHSFTELEDLLL